MTDCALALRASECTAPETLACLPDSLVSNVPDSPFRSVQWNGSGLGPIPIPFQADQAPFIAKHKDDLLVATVEGTSVNHAVGQKRSITGNDAFGGRTMQEACAVHHGEGLVMPNVHLATGTGFTEAGVDRSVPVWARGEAVADPRTWPLSLHGSKGIGRPDLAARARRFRDEVFDPESAYGRRFPEELAEWQDARGVRAPRLEEAELIDRLLFLPSTEQFPLNDFGLSPAPEAARVRQAFPNYATDPFEAQAALAFLLIRGGFSATVTLAPSFNAIVNGLQSGGLVNPPIAFDFSHQAHRGSQALMWARLFGVMDRLIDLLRGEEFEAGGSYWDRTVMYVATEFGRTKNRPENAEEFGSSHDLSNAVMLLSPLARGNRVLGGVDPTTLRTFGWDRATGEPRPGTTNSESDIYGGIMDLLAIPGTGVTSPAFLG